MRAFAPRAHVYPGPIRGVVLATYYADDDGQEQASPPQVLCDVWPLRGGGFIPGVPVMQRGSCVGNVSLWVPQPSRTNLATGEALRLSGDGTIENPPTSPDDLDGEFVVVDWLDGSILRPVVVGSLPHPKGARVQAGLVPQAIPSVTPGEAADLPAGPDGNERYVAHQGLVGRIDRAGNLRLDLAGSGVANDGVTEDAPAGDSGRVDLNLRAGGQLVVRSAGVPVFVVTADADGKVTIDLGRDASERAVLGDRFAALFDGHRHPTPFGTTGPVVLEDRIAPAQDDPARRVLSERVRYPAGDE